MDIKLESGGLFKRKPKRYMGLGLRPPKGEEEKRGNMSGDNAGWDAASERSSIDYADGLLSLKEFLMNQQVTTLHFQSIGSLSE